MDEIGSAYYRPSSTRFPPTPRIAKSQCLVAARNLDLDGLAIEVLKQIKNGGHYKVDPHVLATVKGSAGSVAFHL